MMPFLFWGGYRGIVHPPSDDQGTERTWFEPEQRPRKRVPKRSVHGKHDADPLASALAKPDAGQAIQHPGAAQAVICLAEIQKNNASTAPVKIQIFALLYIAAFPCIHNCVGITSQLITGDHVIKFERNSFRVQLSARGIAICFASAQPKAQVRGGKWSCGLSLSLLFSAV